MSNVLVLHETDYVHKVVFDWQQIPELLSLRGHNVYAIDYEATWSKSSPLDLISKKQEVKVARAYSESSVKLISPTFIKVPVLSRVSAWFSYWKLIEQTIKEKKIDAIILYSVPTNGFQTLRIARKYNIPVIFRSIDTLNQLVKNPYLSKITQVMERYVYRNVDSILVINWKLAFYVIDNGTYNTRVKIVPLGVDTQLFKPDYKPTDNTILFVGTLPRFSGLARFIKLMPEIIKEVSDAKLLIVGDGEQRNDLEALRYSLGKYWDRVTITGYQPHDKIPDFINQARVCINPFEICGATQDIFPTKVIQYMACAKPVVSTALPGLMDAVGERDGIWYANSDESMVHKVATLLKSDVLCKQLGTSGLEYVKRNHSYDKIVDMVEDEINRLLHSCY